MSQELKFWNPIQHQSDLSYWITGGRGVLSSTSCSDGKSGWKSVVAVSGRVINESSNEDQLKTEIS